MENDCIKKVYLYSFKIIGKQNIKIQISIIGEKVFWISGSFAPPLDTITLESVLQDTQQLRQLMLSYLRHLCSSQQDILLHTHL